MRVCIHIWQIYKKTTLPCTAGFPNSRDALNEKCFFACITEGERRGTEGNRMRVKFPRNVSSVSRNGPRNVSRACITEGSRIHVSSLKVDLACITEGKRKENGRRTEGNRHHVKIAKQIRSFHLHNGRKTEGKRKGFSCVSEIMCFFNTLYIYIYIYLDICIKYTYIQYFRAEVKSSLWCTEGTKYLKWFKMHPCATNERWCQIAVFGLQSGQGSPSPLSRLGSKTAPLVFPSGTLRLWWAPLALQSKIVPLSLASGTLRVWLAPLALQYRIVSLSLPYGTVEWSLVSAMGAPN